MRYIWLLVFTLPLLYATNCYAYTIIATEVYSGLYEDGHYEEGKAEFVLKYEVDEENRTITRTQVVNLKTKEIIEDNTVYNITVDTKDIDGDSLITAIGNPGSAATETIQFSKNTYLNSKTVYGYIVISQGTITRQK